MVKIYSLKLGRALLVSGAVSMVGVSTWLWLRTTERTVKIDWKMTPGVKDRNITITFPDYPYWLVGIVDENLARHLDKATFPNHAVMLVRRGHIQNFKSIVGFPGPFPFGYQKECGKPEEGLPLCPVNPNEGYGPAPWE